MEVQLKNPIIAIQYTGEESTKEITEVFGLEVHNYTYDVGETFVEGKIECREFYTNVQGDRIFLRSFSLNLTDWLVLIPTNKGTHNKPLHPFSDENFNIAFKTK